MYTCIINAHNTQDQLHAGQAIDKYYALNIKDNQQHKFIIKS